MRPSRIINDKQKSRRLSNYSSSSDSYKEEDKSLDSNSDERPHDSEETTDGDIMSNLKQSMLKSLNKDFRRWDGKMVQKSEFIAIMLKHLPHNQNKVQKQTMELAELFEQIDVNRDEKMEWQEFSNHIAGSGMIKQDRTFLDAIKNYKLQEWQDTKIHKNEIERIFYFSRIKHLLVIEADSREFQVYELKFGSLNFYKTVKGHRGALTAACHAYKKRKVATAANDLTINLWDDSTYVLYERISCPTFPLVLTYSRKHDILYSSGMDAIIYTWNLDSGREGNNSIKMWNPFSIKDDKVGHKAIVAALLPIKKMNILVSADLHGNILIWNMPHNTQRTRLKGQNKGIYSLDWNSEHSCLFSAGLDREAYVWNPYVKKEIFKLAGHNHSLIGVKCVPKTAQVITGDISGLFRVWDIRTFTSIQTFSIGVKEMNCFDVTFPDKKIIAGTKKLILYQYDEPQDKYLVDESYALFTFYNSLFNTFITVHAKTVKIWNGESGKLQHVLRDLMDEKDISYALLDKYQRKMYLGDSTGAVRSINIINGAKIKSFSGHKDEITGLLFWSEMKKLISCSWNKKILIHDDSKTTDDMQEPIPSKPYLENVNAIALRVMPDVQNGAYLASGTDEGTINIKNLQSSRQDDTIETNGPEIRLLIFLNKSSCLACVDADGLITFWIVDRLIVSKKPIFRIQNKCHVKTENFCSVKSIAYNSFSKLLYTGDEHGYLKVYDIKDVVTQKADPAIHKTFKTEVSIRGSVFQGKPAGELRAHRDTINHICLIEDQGLIITSSFDCTVHIFDESLRMRGRLILATDKNWDIRLNGELRVIAQKAEADNIMKSIYQKHEGVGDVEMDEVKGKIHEVCEQMVGLKGDPKEWSSEDETDDKPNDIIYSLLSWDQNRTEKKLASSSSDYLRNTYKAGRSFNPSRSGLQRAGLSIMKNP